MSKITKEEYLKLLDEVLKAQKVEDLEVNQDFFEEEAPIKPPVRFNYVDSQGTIHATEMTREAIDATWKNQGNVLVGNFLIKVSSFINTAYEPFIYFNIYDYEKDENGKVISSKIDVIKDIRFSNEPWKDTYIYGSSYSQKIQAPLNVTLDVIEWLQKLDKLSAFV